MKSVSAKKAASNRANAARSTGPKTPEGKAIAKLNAVKHGLFSEVSLIEGEAEASLVAFGKRLRADLAPVGEVEFMLADRIVSLAWRIRRLTDIEGECFDRETQSNAAVFNGDRMLKLNRYETTLDRQFYKAMHELQRLQAARRGEHVPAPEAVDVTISTTENKGEGGAEDLASFGKNAGAEIKLVNGHGNHAEHQ